MNAIEHHKKLITQEVQKQHPNFSDQAIRRLVNFMVELDRIEYPEEEELEQHYQRIDRYQFQVEYTPPTKKSRLVLHRVAIEAEQMFPEHTLPNEEPEIPETHTDNPESVNYCDPDNFGRTRLHVAAMEGDDRMVLRLLQEGASPHLKDNNGFNARQIALMYEHEATAQLLSG